MLAVVTIASLCSAQRSVSQKPTAELDNNFSVRLTLQTEKQSYSVGDPVRITAFLENISQDKFFYIGRDLSSLLSEMPYHFIYLSIKDSKGKLVAIGRSSASILETKETIAEKRARSYVQLQPGAIYGLREDYQLPLSPETYSLKAVYQELEALSWQANELRSLKILIWGTPLESNTVKIRITATPAGQSRVKKP